jgi:ATP-dependent exoDNAse (exonuclease V) alpha subunit
MSIGTLAQDGMAKPHAHVMLTMREVGEDGFGAKVRDWNKTEMVEQWRERWADHVNQRLAELDIDARIDHRSLEAQGIALEPQDKIGAPAHRAWACAGSRPSASSCTAKSPQRNGDGSSPTQRRAGRDHQQQATFTRRDHGHVRASAQRRQRAVRSGDERRAHRPT